MDRCRHKKVTLLSLMVPHFFNEREVVFLRDLAMAPLLKNLGPLYTHTKSHDHEKLMGPKIHPLAMPWKIEIQFLQAMSPQA